jgi:hypothetical protein
MTDVSIWATFWLPSLLPLVLAGLLYLTRETRRFGWMVALSLVAVAAMAAWEARLASQDEWVGLFAFISVLPAAVMALIAGICLLALLPRWRKAVGVALEVLCPVALTAAAVWGAQYAPTPPTLAEASLQTVRELMQNIHRPMYDTPVQLWAASDCWQFLDAAATQNHDQYSLRVISTFDQADNPKFVHDATDALISVEFPDGRQAQIGLRNGAVAGCQIAPHK